MFKIAFFDFDGTLFSHSENKIPDSTVLAINKLKENGVICVLATGRPLRDYKAFGVDTLKFDYEIMDAGNRIYDKNFNEVMSFSLTGKAKEEVMNLFNSKEIPVLVVDGDKEIINFKNERTNGIFERVKIIEPPVGECKGDSITMCTVFFLTDEEVKKNINTLTACDYTMWNGNSFDIVAKGYGKHKCVKELLNYLKIDKSEAIAFGDYDNDVSMFECVGTSVCMGNGSTFAKQKATYVTDDIDNDGLYKGLKKYDLL